MYQNDSLILLWEKIKWNKIKFKKNYQSTKKKAWKKASFSLEKQLKNKEKCVSDFNWFSMSILSNVYVIDFSVSDMKGFWKESVTSFWN